MTDRDPTRLIHSADAPADLVQALRLAKTQAPAASSVDAIARGVLAGMGLPGPGTPGGSPPASPGTGGAPPGTTTVTTGAQAALVKGGAVVAAIVVAAGAATLIDTKQEPAPTVEAPSSAVVVETAAPAATSVAVREEKPAPSASEVVPKPPAPPSETALLDAAQRALGSDPAAALRHCAEHAKHYPGGALSQEREVIAIDALVRLGRTADAKARADRFRAQHPGSGHLRRIDVLVGQESP